MTTGAGTHQQPCNTSQVLFLLQDCLSNTLSIKTIVVQCPYIKCKVASDLGLHC